MELNLPLDAPNSPYPQLFSSLTLGRRTLRNRIAFGSVFSGLVERGEVTPALINFLANRAKGGAAMLVAEPFGMWRLVGPAAQGRVYGQMNLDGFRRLADAVSAHDSLLIAQISEQGRGDVRAARRGGAVAPSALPDDLSWTMPHAMSIDEIREMTDDLVLSTIRLQACGFAGVEISAGHGHIVHQFISPWMNRRNDRYGGSFENRMRLLDELAARLRQECGPEFIIGVRLPGCDGLPDSIDWGDSALITRHATTGGSYDYINFVQGSQAWTLHHHLPDMHGPRGPYIDRIGWLKGFSNGVKVASTGRILEPVQAETLLSDGKADFVMLGRTLIADAAWGMKSAQNRDADIRKCVSCNNCWAVSIAGGPTQCDNNPRVGMSEETDWRPSRTAAGKRVTVIGGGVSGLEAAWVAAARGHEVTLFSNSAELGGRVRLFSRLPGCESISSIFDYQIATAQRAGVHFELSHQATASDVAGCRPDAIVLATGGLFCWPEQLPRSLYDEGLVVDMPTVLRDLVGRSSHIGGTAVIYDMDGTEMTYAGATLLADLFDRVVIVTPVECAARDQATVKKQSIHRRLMEKNIEVITWSEPSPDSRFEEARFVHRNVMTGRQGAIEDVGLFTYATARAPHNELLPVLRTVCPNIYLVGDARNACSTMTAVQDGHVTGCNV
jgi:2,4-dienoyl-CoA reductase-like NADH-dependent reductase (Old Yellow Enzyme family)/thioredoxin reductase